MSKTPRTPCSRCGFLHRYSGALPKGKKAKCNNCGSSFTIQESHNTPDDVRFLVFNGGQNLGSPSKCVGENYHRSEFLKILSQMKYNKSDPPAMIAGVFSLVPETDNEHDANAVRVELDGAHLAYLSRRDAKLHREGLVGLGKPLFRFNVSGRITLFWSGLPDDEDEESFEDDDEEDDTDETNEDAEIVFRKFKIELDISWTE